MNFHRFLALALALACSWVSLPLGAADQESAASGPDDREADAGEAIGQAWDWLSSRQTDDGSFRSADTSGVCSAARTAMALWALSVTRPAGQAGAPCREAAGYLLSMQKEDGGIFDAGSGLRFSTSAVVRQALRAYQEAGGEHEAVSSALNGLELFLSQQHAQESQDSQRAAAVAEDVERRIGALGQDPDLSTGVDRALKFLRRIEGGKKSPGAESPPRRAQALTYRQLLEQVGQDLTPQSETVQKAIAVLKDDYTLEKNPDLTRRFGAADPRQGSAGLYYYYLTLARTLGCTGSPVLETTDGTSHDWPRELEQRILSLQQPDGSWRNSNGRWWEDDPVLVTAYALITLSICRDLHKESP